MTKRMLRQSKIHASLPRREVPDMDFQGSGAMEVEELPLFHFGESVSLMESLPLKCAAGCRRRVAGGGLQSRL